MRLRLISLSVLPAVLILAGVVGWNELVATEPDAETALYGTPQLSQSSAGPSARGHVDIVLNEGQRGIERYSFTARQHSDGTVRGQFQSFTNVGTEFETQVHGEVTCMTLMPDGRTARLGGTITHTVPALPDGQPLGVAWVVHDGGEGGNAVDGGSLMLFGIPEEFVAENCAVFGIPPQASARGNVQVSTR